MDQSEESSRFTPEMMTELDEAIERAVSPDGPVPTRRRPAGPDPG